MATHPYHIPIDRAGRVILPKDVRDRLGLREGTEFEVSDDGQKIILRPVEKEPKTVVKGGVLVVLPDVSPEHSEVEDLIDKVRTQRNRHV